MLSFYDSSPLKQSEIERLLNKKKCLKTAKSLIYLEKKMLQYLNSILEHSFFWSSYFGKSFHWKEFTWFLEDARSFLELFFFKSGFVGHFCLCLTYYCPPRHTVWYFSKVQDHGQKQKRLTSFFLHIWREQAHIETLDLVNLLSQIILCLFHLQIR